ncbi:SNF2 family N-terminal domain-containing protein [Phyllosticta capitalensis]
MSSGSGACMGQDPDHDHLQSSQETLRIFSEGYEDLLLAPVWSDWKDVGDIQEGHSTIMRYCFNGTDGQFRDKAWEMFSAGQKLEGAGLMCEKLAKYHAAILADDMGLGKTLQVVAVLIERPLDKPTLIVVPNGLMRVWEKELERVQDPPLRVLALDGKEAKTATSKVFQKHDVVICTYNTLHVQHSALAKYLKDWDAEVQLKGLSKAPQRPNVELISTSWGRLVVDEAHLAISSLESQRNAAACAILADERIACTGTILTNDNTDVLAILNFLQIDPWGDIVKFFKHFIKKGRSISRSDQLRETQNALLATVLRTIMIRRRLFDHFGNERLSDVPEPEIELVNIPLTEEESQFQKDTRHLWCKEALVGQKVPGPGLDGTAMRSLITIARSKILHPSIGSDADTNNGGKLSAKRRCEEIAKLTVDSWKESSRMKACVDLIKERLKHGKVLVFSEFKQVFYILANGLENIHYNHYNGDVKTDARDALVRDFQSGPSTDPKLLLITSKTGGTGLTLTQAKSVILLNPSWKLASDVQCIGRAVRYGQSDTVKVYILSSEDSIEARCQAIQQIKKPYSERLLDVEQISEEKKYELGEWEKDDFINYLESSSLGSSGREERLAGKLGLPFERNDVVEQRGDGETADKANNRDLEEYDEEFDQDPDLMQDFEAMDEH